MQPDYRSPEELVASIKATRERIIAALGLNGTTVLDTKVTVIACLDIAVLVTLVSVGGIERRGRARDLIGELVDQTFNGYEAVTEKSIKEKLDKYPLDVAALRTAGVIK